MKSEQTLQDELRAMRDLVRTSRDGFLNGQPYILTYTDIEERLTDLLGEQMWPCPDCDSLGTEHAPNCKRLAALLAKQAAPRPAITLICRTCEKPYPFNGVEIPGGPGRDFCGGSCYNYFHADKKWTEQSEQLAAPAEADKRTSQSGVSADQLRQASEQAFMNIPDPHTSSAHFNEMARLLNAALALAVPQPAAAPASVTFTSDGPISASSGITMPFTVSRAKSVEYDHNSPIVKALEAAHAQWYQEGCHEPGCGCWTVIANDHLAPVLAQRDRELIERGVKAGIEAAAKLVASGQGYQADGIRALDSAAIAEKVPGK